MVSPERVWLGFAIPLSKLAETDDCPSPVALADAVGDRYLCRHNPVFASIREAALGFGYRFSARDTPMWRDYLALPLTALHQILSEKVIPYHNTGETLRRLLEINPNASLAPNFILDNMKRNYAFHEAAHCVAHSVLNEMGPCLKAIAPSERDRFVLEGIFAESLANTVEKLGTLCLAARVWDLIFYSLNSYVGPKDKTTEVLEKAKEEWGEYARFAVLFLSSFEANLTAGEPGDGIYERIGEVANCPSGDAKMAREVINTGFKLSDVFREYTTPGYFEFLGYKNEYLALSKSAWLDQPDNQSFARDLVQRLVTIVGARETRIPER